jgi:hypothetical protein
MDWAQFWPLFCKRYGHATRDQAEHVTILGATGTGKSSLAMRIATRRPYVVQLVEKPRDEKLRLALKRDGYRPATVLPEPSGYRRVYVWPPAGGVTDEAGQRKAFRDVLRRAGRNGVWHTVCHETAFMVDPLGLAPELKYLLRMGRSNGAGVILCSQRPAWLPRDVYSQASHLFLFGTNDVEDLKKLSGLNGMDSGRVRDAVASLGAAGDLHRFLYVGTRDGTLMTCRAPAGLDERNRIR